jgi:hypothetical protein
MSQLAANQLYNQPREPGSVFVVTEFDDRGELIIHFYTLNTLGQVKRVNLKDLRVKP